jgi:tetraprenyl-beta-curcumene synthase
VALCAVSARELAWIRPNVAREVDGWRERAKSIPDPTIRGDALEALADKRLNAEGAALFAVLPPRRDLHLLRLLVAFQVLLDFLDSVSERPAPDPLADGRQLHLALRDALDPGGPIRDYYRHHPRGEDGGYLRALVQSCRESCAALPAYEQVRDLALQGAQRCSVQGLNHDPDCARRDIRLERWARVTFPEAVGMSWWELSAAASSTLGIHALLALAADPRGVAREAEEIDSAYMPWICAASTMLDSYVDEVEDAASAGHSYIAHYASAKVAAERTSELVWRSLQEARRLRNGPRHALIAAGMVAMYLSAADARTSPKRATTRAFLRAGGAHTRLLLPILRLWRARSSAATHLPSAVDAGHTSVEESTTVGGRQRVRNTHDDVVRDLGAPRRWPLADACQEAGLRALVRTEHSGQPFLGGETSVMISLTR